MAGWIRDSLSAYAFTLDGWSHKRPIKWLLPQRVHHFVCLAADVTVGWGPDAADWERNAARHPELVWFYGWYWNGRCDFCGGTGEIHWLHPNDQIKPCGKCMGSGLQPR